MWLTADYIHMHLHDFRLRKRDGLYSNKQKWNSPIEYMEDCCEPKNFKNLITSDSLRMRDIHDVRRWVWFVFDKILKLHCYLEWLDYQREHNNRYTYIWGNAVLKSRSESFQVPKRKSRWRGWSSISTWEHWFGSLLKQWSRESIARKEYDCCKCSERIYPWQRYARDVFRLWESIDIVYYHIDCPPDPDDPNHRRRSDHDIVEQPSPIMSQSTKAA